MTPNCHHYTKMKSLNSTLIEYKAKKTFQFTSLKPSTSFKAQVMMKITGQLNQNHLIQSQR